MFRPEWDLGGPHGNTTLLHVRFSRGNLADPLSKLVVMLKSNNSINFRELLREKVCVPLGKTTRHDNAFGETVGLAAGGGEDGIDALTLRVLDEAAGIDDDHISISGVGRVLDLNALLRKITEEDLSVCDVLGAA